MESKYRKCFTSLGFELTFTFLRRTLCRVRRQKSFVLITALWELVNTQRMFKMTHSCESISRNLSASLALAGCSALALDLLPNIQHWRSASAPQGPDNTENSEENKRPPTRKLRRPPPLLAIIFLGLKTGRFYQIDFVLLTAAPMAWTGTIANALPRRPLRRVSADHPEHSVRSRRPRRSRVLAHAHTSLKRRQAVSHTCRTP